MSNPYLDDKDEVKAINYKHQSNVNRFIRWNNKYDELVDAGREERY